MRDDQHRFLMILGQLPARLTAEQVAWVLNCQSHDVPVLVAARLLKPLGNPPPNGVKYFGTAELLELMKDKSWLVKVTNAVNQHWRNQNTKKKSRLANAENGQTVFAASPVS
jgi:hypothetical protein